MESNHTAATILRLEIESAKGRIRNYKIARDSAIVKSKEADALIEEDERKIKNLKLSRNKLEV